VAGLQSNLASLACSCKMCVPFHSDRRLRPGRIPKRCGKNRVRRQAAAASSLSPIVAFVKPDSQKASRKNWMIFRKSRGGLAVAEVGNRHIQTSGLNWTTEFFPTPASRLPVGTHWDATTFVAKRFDSGGRRGEMVSAGGRVKHGFRTACSLRGPTIRNRRKDGQSPIDGVAMGMWCLKLGSPSGAVARLKSHFFGSASTSAHGRGNFPWIWPQFRQ
jgi:hypothetical protein